MGRGDDLVHAEQRILLGRLLQEDVESGAGDMAGLDGGLEVRFDHEATAGAVDDSDPFFRLGDGLGVDQVARGICERRVQGDDVGARQQLVERHLLHVEVAGALVGEIGIEGDDPHLQAVGTLGHDRADIAAADDAEGLARELHAHEARLLPFAGLGGFVGGGNLAGEREHHGDRMLGRGDGVAVRRVHDDDAALGRRGHIDVVDADAGAADHLQIRCGGKDLGGHLCRGAHGEAVIVGDGRLEVGRLQAGADIDLNAALAEDRDRVGAQFIGDQDLRHSSLPTED